MYHTYQNAAQRPMQTDYTICLQKLYRPSRYGITVGPYGPVQLTTDTWITRVPVGTPLRTMCWYTDTNRYVMTRQISKQGPIPKIVNPVFAN